MSEMMMNLGVRLGDERSFKTGVEGLVQSTFGYVGCWDTICPDWDTKQAMELWFKDPEAFCNRLADFLIPLLRP